MQQLLHVLRACELLPPPTRTAAQPRLVVVHWLGASVEKDPYGAAMIAAGVPKDTLVEWTTDPVVAGGRLGLVFGRVFVLESVSGLAHLPRGRR